MTLFVLTRRSRWILWTGDNGASPNGHPCTVAAFNWRVASRADVVHLRDANFDRETGPVLMRLDKLLTKQQANNHLYTIGGQTATALFKKKEEKRWMGYEGGGQLSPVSSSDGTGDTLARASSARFDTYLGQVLIRQQMQLPGFEAVLALALVEEVRLELPTGVFFCGGHCASPRLSPPTLLTTRTLGWSCNPAV